MIDISVPARKSRIMSVRVRAAGRGFGSGSGPLEEGIRWKLCTIESSKSQLSRCSVPQESGCFVLVKWFNGY